MADYYPLIARAIAGLDPSAPGESRRALYERARTALIAQLRSVDPPLSESEITRERLSLEEAVRKVESEAAARARDLSRPDSAGRSRPGDAFRANPRSGAKPGEAAPAEPSSAQPPAQPPARARQPIVPTPPPPRPPIGGDDQRSQRNLRAEPANRERGAPPRRDADRQPPPPPGPPPLRGFRDVTADADDLGRATAQASRAARKTYANVPSQSGEFDRLEPSLEDRAGGDAYSYDESVEEAARYQQPSPRPRIAPEQDKKRRTVRAGGGFPLKSAIALGVVLILAGAAILWGPKLVTAARSLLTSSAPQQQAEPAKDTSPAPKPKIPDRVGQPSSSDQIAPVAQKVVLYDEDPTDPKGKQYVGTVVWRTEPVKGSAGKPGDLSVRADIDIPDRKFKMTMSFRRNTDTSLPASHTAELTFILPPDFAGGGVANVPGILMKSNEQARGTPLAGLAVKVTDGFFLVGLSNVEADRVRNLQLLKERSWFDVPLVYTNQRRAIIAIEKGPPGERAFNDAFAAWGE